MSKENKNTPQNPSPEIFLRFRDIAKKAKKKVLKPLIFVLLISAVLVIGFYLLGGPLIAALVFLACLAVVILGFAVYFVVLWIDGIALKSNKVSLETAKYKESEKKIAALEKREVGALNRLTQLEDRRRRLEARAKKLEERAVNLERRVTGISHQIAGSFEHTPIGMDVKILRNEVDDLAYSVQFLQSLPGGRKEKHQMFPRVVSEASFNTMLEVWCPALGLQLDRRALSYLADKIQELEKRCVGRLATSLDNCLLRVLVLKSLASKVKNLQMLEVGSLFGTSMAAFIECSIGDFESFRALAIDPLDGYYGEKRLDPITGQAVTPRVFRRNLAMAGAIDGEVELIQKLSTDPSVKTDLEGLELDLILIDGDHTYDGVKFDHDLLTPYLKVGGYVIYDDYEVREWPDVKRFVDETVSTDTAQFELVGTGFRSAIFKRIAKSKA